MEVIPVSSNEIDRLTAEQRDVWERMRIHVPKPSCQQTRQQAINLGVLSFLWWCDFDGLAPQPTQAAVRAEFKAMGVPELCPGPEFWDHLRRNPSYPWILAPGANRERWDPGLLGRPTVYAMERPP
jgi:hypothetical protein